MMIMGSDSSRNELSHHDLLKMTEENIAALEKLYAENKGSMTAKDKCELLSLLTEMTNFAIELRDRNATTQ